MVAPPRACIADRSRQSGFSVAELAVTTGLVATLAALSVAPLASIGNPLRAASAARYLASLLQAARMSAVQQGRSVALRFERGRDGYGWITCVDGDGDGVRTSDITGGTDPCAGERVTIGAAVPGVDLGAPAGVPQVDAAVPVGDDPVRLGTSDLLSFAPEGTATSGTLYVVGQGGHAWAVRVLGATGRVRLHRFDSAQGLWVTP